MNKTKIPNHKPFFDFYICPNDSCLYFGQHGERAAGDENMKVNTIPAGYYQGHPLCLWCEEEMSVAHTDEQENPPHIEWDGIDPVHGKYYQLKFWRDLTTDEIV